LHDVAFGAWPQAIVEQAAAIDASASQRIMELPLQ